MRLSAPVHRLKRRARDLARAENIPLHAALDRMARAEGFASWGLLSSRLAAAPGTLLHRLAGGDLLLIAARPGQGKTLLGLQLLLDAARAGRRAVFYTLEYTAAEAEARIRALDSREGPHGVEIVTADDIGADFIAAHLSGAAPGTVAVIDYLRILDQARSRPVLADQMLALRAFAQATGVILGFIAQVDRAYDPAQDPVPGLAHLRLPNPLPPGLFTRACFLHGGEARFRDPA